MNGLIGRPYRFGRPLPGCEHRAVGFPARRGAVALSSPKGPNLLRSLAIFSVYGTALHKQPDSCVGLGRLHHLLSTVFAPLSCGGAIGVWAVGNLYVREMNIFVGECPWCLRGH
jgi:hypothetical protein